MKPTRRQGSRSLSARRGGALVVALTTLLVVMLITGTVLRSLLGSYRQTRQSHLELQACWLAEGAAERARAQLQANSVYEGETWQPAIAPPAGGDERHGVVEIRVERSADAKLVRVIVDARYPDDPWQRVAVQRSYDFATGGSISAEKNQNNSSQEKAP
jgi:Tfp pilus assembly protein PilX